jgi:hypothetical protein
MFSFGSLWNLATNRHLIDMMPHLLPGATEFPKPHFDFLDRRQKFGLFWFAIVVFHNALLVRHAWRFHAFSKQISVNVGIRHSTDFSGSTLG